MNLVAADLFAATYARFPAAVPWWPALIWAVALLDYLKATLDLGSSLLERAGCGSAAAPAAVGPRQIEQLAYILPCTRPGNRVGVTAHEAMDHTTG